MDKRSTVVAGEPVRITSNGRRYFSKAYREAVIAKCLAPGRHAADSQLGPRGTPLPGAIIWNN